VRGPLIERGPRVHGEGVVVSHWPRPVARRHGRDSMGWRRRDVAAEMLVVAAEVVGLQRRVRVSAAGGSGGGSNGRQVGIDGGGTRRRFKASWEAPVQSGVVETVVTRQPPERGRTRTGRPHGPVVGGDGGGREMSVDAVGIGNGEQGVLKGGGGKGIRRGRGLVGRWRKMIQGGFGIKQQPVTLFRKRKNWVFNDQPGFGFHLGLRFH
jgi:hypothetical protein